MKITCIDKETKKLFETGYYNIPRFQRAYSWEKEQILEFWNDVIFGGTSEYFIGSIVVYKKTTDIYGIVDGQQRLTTITMILCALRNLYEKEGFTNSAKGVQALVEKIDLDNHSSYILQTETSYPYFQEHIQKYGKPDVSVNFGQEETTLKAGFEQISGYLTSEIKKIKTGSLPEESSEKIQSRLNEIRDKTLQLKVIYIELDNEDDAYVIFETLNTRGKDLSTGDLVKNYLTKNIRQANVMVDITKDKWNKIRENIDSTSKDVNIDTFLLHVWLSKYSYTTSKGLFKDFKKKILANKAKSFLNDLVIDSENYKHIIDPETRKWSKNDLVLKSSLVSLNNFNVAQQTPMVLAIIRQYETKKLKFKYAREALEAIEHFHYIFNAITSQRSSGSIATMYSTYARLLEGAGNDVNKLEVIRELRIKMKEKIPSVEEFLIGFKNLKFTNGFTKDKKIIHYTLSKLDSFNSNGSSLNYDLMTLEHILPQSSVPHKDVVGRIGNLLLINEALNVRLGQKKFPEKKSILLSTNIYLDEIIKDSNDWNPTTIESRTNYLADIAYNRVFRV